MFQCAINKKRRLLFHPFCDCMSNSVVGLRPSSTVLHTVFIINILFGCPGKQKKNKSVPKNKGFLTTAHICMFKESAYPQLCWAHQSVQAVYN